MTPSASPGEVAISPDRIAVVHRRCPLCDTDNSGRPPSSYSLPPWTIRECGNCRFVYIDTAPEYRHLEVDLDWDVRYGAEITRKIETRKAIYTVGRLTRWRKRIFPKRRVADFIKARHERGRIVDLGCSNGADLSRDLLDTFEPYGIEISAKLAAEANALFRRHGGRVECAPCIVGLQRFPADYFEAAALRSYLEHESQPLGVLKELFRVLKPGGIAVVKVPNYGSWNRRVMGRKWCGFRYPDHLNYFTRSSLRQFAQHCGFVIDFSLLGSLPTSDNMWAVLTKP